MSDGHGNRQDRGEWRGIYTVLSDTPEFQDLGPDAQLIWFHLKLRLGAAGIDTLPAAEYVVSDAAGIPSERVRDGIEILSEGGWLIRERNVFWLRNALKFEPSRNLSNPNHVKSIRSHIAGLPKLAIVNDFADYYELDRPFPDATPSEGYRDTTPDNGRRKTEDGIRKTDTSPPPRANESEEPTEAVRGIYGWEGSEGTDPVLMKAFPDSTEERDRCLRIAWGRLQAEGKQYHGRLFRRILEAVIDEQSDDGEGGWLYDDEVA